MLALSVLKAENLWLRGLGLRRGPVHDLRGAAGTLTNLIYLLNQASIDELRPLFEGVLKNLRAGLQELDDIKNPGPPAETHSLQECAEALRLLEVAVPQMGPDGPVQEALHLLIAIHVAEAPLESLEADRCVFEGEPGRWTDIALGGSEWTRVGTTIQRKY